MTLANGAASLPLSWVRILDGENWSAPSSVDRGPIPTLIAHMERHLQPGNETRIRKALATLAIAVRNPGGDQTDRAAQAALFVKFLGEYPEWAVEKSCETWIKTQKFWPAVSEIRALCEDAVKLDRIRLARLRKILAIQPNDRPPPTPEQIARVSRIARETVAALRADNRS